jgi:cell fate (sporulation/competence/biofilm development) regulator YlbF (YheA/YmcA/DUF963 family)
MNTDTYDTALGIEVQQAARAFAIALSETREFQAFEEAATALQNDTVARCAIEAYQQREQSLRALHMLGAVSPMELQELERLRQAYVEEPSVVAYVAAQEALTHLAQAGADRLTQQIGLDLVAACGGSCCG